MATKRERDTIFDAVFGDYSEVRNKKVRLLVTAECPNKCPKCCNKLYDLNATPVIDRWDYEEFILTGGEPALFPDNLLRLIKSIKGVQAAQGITSKVYIYTAKTTLLWNEAVMASIDGITYTPHNKEDVQFLINVNENFLEEGIFKHYAVTKEPTLRLYLFPEIERLLPKDIDLSLWEIKHMVWRNECPVPAGEDFRRVDTLWI